MKLRFVPASLLALAGVFLATMPAASAEADIALIKGYIGSWRGSGDIIWSDANGVPETLQCRMSVQDSDITKIGVDGRCSLAGGTLSMLGTIAWVDENNRYEAIVSSNTTFTGIAIGHREGDSLTFDLRDFRANDDSIYDIAADITLAGDTIQMDMTVTNKQTGDLTTAEIPFVRR